MIITVTLNPSVDRTVELPGPLRPGGVHRAVTTHEEPGGKGVNIARAVQAFGEDVVAVVPGDPTDPLLAGLDAAGVRYDNVPIGAPLRTNVTVTDPAGVTTKINEPGPAMDAHTTEQIMERLTSRGAGAAWLVLSGSVPPGPSADVYARIVHSVRTSLGAAAPLIAVDASGAPLAETLAGTAAGLPDLVKPNAHELAELLGRSDGDLLEADPVAAARAARDLVSRGVGTVLCTLGSHGAVLVTREGAWHGVHEPITVRSTVGAGDSSLGGYLLAHLNGADAQQCLRRAVAHGSAAAAMPGTGLPSPGHVRLDAVTVTPLPAS